MSEQRQDCVALPGENGQAGILPRHRSESLCWSAARLTAHAAIKAAYCPSAAGRKVELTPHQTNEPRHKHPRERAAILSGRGPSPRQRTPQLRAPSRSLCSTDIVPSTHKIFQAAASCSAVSAAMGAHQGGPSPSAHSKAQYVSCDLEIRYACRES